MRTGICTGADNYEVVSLPLNSEALKQEVTRVFPRIIFATGFGFSDVIANRNAVVLGETLGEYAKRFADLTATPTGFEAAGTNIK